MGPYKIFTKLFIAVTLLIFSSSLWAKPKYSWYPLFNHYDSTSQKNSQAIGQFLELLNLQVKNAVLNEATGEYISQEQFNVLLRESVKLQLKAVDFLTAAITFTCTKDLAKCSDAKEVITSLLTVQNRIEEIESGRLNPEELPPSIRQIFSETKLLCYYIDFATPESLSKFNLEQQKLFETSMSSSHSSVDQLLNHLSETFQQTPEKESLRTLVARCARAERIQQWKQILSDQSFDR